MKIFFAIFLVATYGCVVKHHAQFGEIDGRGGLGRRFEVKVSETGVNLSEASSVAKSLTRSKAAQKDIETVRDIISMFQMGPKTGNIVFHDDYAEKLLSMILSQCSSGKITGLSLIRESNKYPVISGEIVKVRGYCKLGKGGSSV